MPLAPRGNKTLWISSGVFLFLGGLIIVIPAQTMPVALFLPALYCIWAERWGRMNPFLISLVPVFLAVIPAFVQGVIPYVSLLLCGFIMRAMVKKGRVGLSVFIPACLLFSLFVIVLSLVAHAEGNTIYKIIQQWVGRMMEQVYQVYTSILSPGDLTTFKVQRPQLEEKIARFSPALTLAGLTFSLWLNLIIVAAVKKDLNLRTWKSPDWVLLLFIVSGLCTFVPLILVQAAGYNLLIMVSLVYFFQGLSIVAYYLDVRGWGTLLRWIIYLLILSQLYIMIIVALLGLFDTWFYFRKLIRKNKGELV
jgi:hypothetical protein